MEFETLLPKSSSGDRDTEVKLLMETNRTSGKYGLQLSEQQAGELVSAEASLCAEGERIRLGGSAAALLAEYKAAAQSVVDTAQNQAALDMDVADFNRTTNQNDYNKLLERAEALAQFGDFSGYLALGFSQDQVNNMRKTWLAANPKIAAYL